MHRVRICTAGSVSIPGEDTSYPLMPPLTQASSPAITSHPCNFYHRTQLSNKIQSPDGDAPPRPPPPSGGGQYGSLAPPRPPPPDTDDEADNMFEHAPTPSQGPIMVRRNGGEMCNLLVCHHPPVTEMQRETVFTSDGGPRVAPGSAPVEQQGQ